MQALTNTKNGLLALLAALAIAFATVAVTANTTLAAKPDKSGGGSSSCTCESTQRGPRQCLRACV